MNSIKAVSLCAAISFKKLLTSSRLYILLLMLLIYHYMSFSFLSELVTLTGSEATSWIFPFFLGNPTMFIVFGASAMLLYGNAPFADDHTPFLLIRAGKRNWIWGQLLFIFLSSLAYTLCQVLFSILVLLPQGNFSGDWGNILWTLATDSSAFIESGINIGFQPYIKLIELFTPIQATMIAIVLYWLGTLFIACVILFVNLLTKRNAGLVVAGALTSLAYFVCYLGSLSLGEWMYSISPITWSCISYLNWFHEGSFPSPMFAITAYSVMIIALISGSIVLYCQRDVDTYEGGN